MVIFDVEGHVQLFECGCLPALVSLWSEHLKSLGQSVLIAAAHHLTVGLQAVLVQVN
jgi:hypothetical protein